MVRINLLDAHKRPEGAVQSYGGAFHFVTPYREGRGFAVITVHGSPVLSPFYIASKVRPVIRYKEN